MVEVLRTGRLSLGPKLEEFERALAEHVVLPYAVAVNSGTSGLHLSIRALGIKEGDKVITSPFSFIASANAILYERAVPVFVDIDPVTLNIDPEKIEPAITPRTRAVLAVHVFGRPAPMREIMAIAGRHNLMVIEDACEALGAECDGRRVGAFGEVGVFAFYPNKQITAGEGGAIVTRNPALAARCKGLRNHGRVEPGSIDHVELGYSFRLSEINCALGLEQIKRIEAVLKQRESVARRYHERLAGCADLILPELEARNGRIGWFAYVVRLSEAFAKEDRDWIVREMMARGIGCGRYFPPIHLQPFYRARFGYRPGDFPITEQVAARTIALPFFNRIRDEEIDEVCRTLTGLVRMRKATARPVDLG